MVKLSRYAHIYNIGDAVALIHSLRLEPVYLDAMAYQGLKAWLDSSSCVVLDEAPSKIQEEVQELAKRRILIQSDDEDDKALKFVRSHIPKPSISVCYFILSEQCNLACKYCFLGNNNLAIRTNFMRDNMSIETAEKAISFYLKQLSLSEYSEIRKPAVIFYGGEPLVNYEVLVHIAKRLNALRGSERTLKNLEMSVITNGLLLNEERLCTLNELGVGISVSIDGFTEEANNMRVDVSGKPIFGDLLSILEMCRRCGVDISLSVTLSEETLKSTEHVLELLKNYHIGGLGFNILMSDNTFTLPYSYDEKAAQYIIDAFIKLRELGIYEDRMMRKLDSFTKHQVYFSDCAATAGGQIVVAPDGNIGVCHGCIAGKKYFVTNVDDCNFDAKCDPTFLEWSQLSPVNKDECLDCEALGICGGGCPVNAMHSKPNNSLHSIDERFCAHAKKSLEFFVNDLYEKLVLEAKNK